jgi:hypothetical protein
MHSFSAEGMISWLGMSVLLLSLMVSLTHWRASDIVKVE